MREIRLSGSEGGGFEPNRFSLPLSWVEARFRAWGLGRPGQGPSWAGRPWNKPAASKLALAKAAASCTQSKASLRTPGGTTVTSSSRTRPDSLIAPQQMIYNRVSNIAEGTIYASI